MTSNESREHRANASPLTKEELIWRSRYNMLESHGYRLRQRYKPDWMPSWLNTKRPASLHEDYTAHWNSEVIDAVRIADGRRVFLKRVPDDGSELRIHRYLWVEERRKDPHNHTVPLLDEFPEDDAPTYIYMVMPLLRPYYLPEFFSVEEVVDFMRQILEGILYMHKANVAHRDCSDLNVMMDADAMFPKGFHPVSKAMDSSGADLVHPKRRRDTVPRVRYYFIDFGISSMFGPEDKERTVIGLEGQDTSVPELSLFDPYDPFRTDVYILGNLFKTAFLDKYDNLEFLQFLIEDMTQHFPRARADSEKQLDYFYSIIARQSPHSLRWRLKRKKLGSAENFLLDVGSISHESIYLTKRVFSLTAGSIVRFLRKRLQLRRKHKLNGLDPICLR